MLPLQLNSFDPMGITLKSKSSSHGLYSQCQSQQPQHQGQRRNLSDPLVSPPNMVHTPNVYDGSVSTDNYTHQTQNSISSLASMYSANNPNLLSSVGGSSTTVSDGSYLLNNSGSLAGTSYEPVTPPDYFPPVASNFDSHSRKSSMSNMFWNQPNNVKLHSWSQTGAGSNGSISGAGSSMSTSSNLGAASSSAHSLRHIPSVADLDLSTVPETAALPQQLHTKHASIDDMHQRFMSRQRYMSVPIHSSSNSCSSSAGGSGTNLNTMFEQQFKQLTISTSSPELSPITATSTGNKNSAGGMNNNNNNISPNSAGGFQTHKRSSTFPIVGPAGSSLGNAADILNLSKDQYGCRILQKKIDEDFSGSYMLIFQAVYAHSAELMVDPFGNYLIQKIMVNAFDEQLNLILMNATPQFGTIAMNQHGTRACQKLIDCLSTPTHYKLLEECLSPHIVGLVQDLNGNHVIQKCIQKFKNEDLQFIIESICKNMIQIATHKHGCCVLQKLLTKCNDIQVLRLGQEIIKNSIVLMQDQFGNYVVQYLITLDINALNIALIDIMIPYIADLSSQKFSSNVVEKCLKIRLTNQMNAEVINPLFKALLQPRVLSALINDQYGNYVVQTAMELSPQSYKLRFATNMKPLLPLVRFSSFGKRIHNKVVSILNENERLEQQQQQLQQFQQQQQQQQQNMAKMENSLSGLLMRCNANVNVNVNPEHIRSSSCSMIPHQQFFSQQQNEQLLPPFPFNASPVDNVPPCGLPVQLPVYVSNSNRNPNDVEKFL
ncbi:unnamed protein product [Ambrosiozyma monospora]|uniref:Unnamed protein product n=1 Tax=Ambrosiozyma monospora TaxID=43982 RepID=A0A9W6YTG4_AMBMO|nr:unnamed protein product [Ambrosiozyma monospora]